MPEDKNIEILSQTLAELLEMPPEADIYQFIGEKLHKLVGDSYIIVNSFDEGTKKTYTRGLFGLGERTNGVLKILGKHPVGNTFTLSELAISELTSGGITKPPKGMEDLSPDIPAVAARALEALLDIGDIYSMGFSWKGRLFGNVVILLRRHNKFSDMRVIEAFIRQISIVMQRRYVETELKHAEEERMRLSTMGTIIKAMVDPVFVFDLEGKVSFVNQAYLGMFGLKEEAAVGSHLMEIGGIEKQKSEEIAKFMPLINECIEKGSAGPVELSIVNVNGREIAVSTAGGLIKDPQRNPTHIVAVLRDITERKKEEESLRKVSECFISFGPDSSQNLKLITETMGKLLGATCALYNRKEGDLLVTLAGWQLPPDLPLSDKGKGHICFDVIARGGKDPLVINDLQNSIYVNTDPNVKKYNLQTYIEYPVKLNDQPVASLCAVFQSDFKLNSYHLKLIQMLGTAASVEEKRKQAEEELRKAKEYTENIISDMGDSLIVVDSQAKIMTINEATEQLLGYTREELIGQPVGMIFEEEEEEEELFKGTGLKRLIKKGFIKNQERIYKTKKGARIPVLFSGSVMRDENGKIQGIVCVARDITELKQLQEELLKAGKMTVVGELGAGVAHQLNNPLGAIIGFAQLVLKELSSRDSKYDDLKKIEQAGLRCKRIIESLLRFSRPGEAMIKRVSINKLVKDTVFLFEQQLKSRPNIKLSTDLQRFMPRIFGNPVQLEQVFLNMLTNAQNALPRGGKISVSTKMDREKGNVMIIFEDNGTGIAERDLYNIFKPFYTLKKTPESVGLGLTLSVRIVESHKGSIDVESVLGKGTKFTVNLPI